MKKVGNCYLLFNLIKAYLNGRFIEQKLYGHNNWTTFLTTILLSLSWIVVRLRRF